MQSIIVTGGIATGKSALCRSWLALEPDTVFHDADAVVHQLYREPEMQAELAALFGPQVVNGSGEVDRAHIRREIFSAPDKRRELESLVHPRVRIRCIEAHERASGAGAPWFLADIPLFFEGGGWKPVTGTHVVVVACSPAIQLERLLQRNPFDKPEAERIIASQADLSAKMAAADHVLWNEGSPPVLQRQSRLLRDCLRRLT